MSVGTGPIIGPDDMGGGRGSEPARTSRAEQQPLVAGRAASPTAHSSGCALVAGLAVERPAHAKGGGGTLTGSPGEAASPAPPPGAGRGGCARTCATPNSHKICAIHGERLALGARGAGWEHPRRL